MPETKFQDFVYTLIMAFLMVYVMVCYNISIHTGGLSNFVFIEAFKELPFMWIVAIILEFFLIGKVAPEFCSCLYYQYALKPFSIRPFLCQYFYIFMLCNLM